MAGDPADVERGAAAHRGTATSDDAPLDLLVLGSGVAGLSAAVRAAEVHGMRVGVLTKGELHQATTRWAQGGVAAVLGGDPDSTDLHLADTLAAGAGLCDTDAVRVLVDEGPGRVNELIALGAMFDVDEHGAFQLAREGGHSLPRIVHAGGAATGMEIERALVDAVNRTAAVVHESSFASELLVRAGRCVGVRAIDASGAAREVHADNVLVATGGAGQLFSVTTNPIEVTGDGVGMALRAGVAVADLEFVQFHPTALHHPAMPRPLLSEALRGHGALLRDTAGERFVDELLPRDEVSRAMTTRMLAQGVDHLWLDATGLAAFDERFPTLAAQLAEVGLDPAVDWLPIAPAAHYLCGGIVTDLDGAASLPGVWAAGEAACSGVHGANRLASNSLLEGMVFAFRVVEAVERGVTGPSSTGAMRAVLDGAVATEDPASVSTIGGRRLAGTVGAAGEATAAPPVPGEIDAVTADPVTADAAGVRAALQRAMTIGAGVVRTADSLADTAATVAACRAAVPPDVLDPSWLEVQNLCDVADALVLAATERTESRGAHTRSDFPDRDPALRCRLVIGGP